MQKKLDAQQYNTALSQKFSMTVPESVSETEHLSSGFISSAAR